MGINVAKSLDREKIEEIRCLKEISSMREELHEGPFLVLPLEMILNIISFLEHSDVISLCMLNWSWNIFIEKSPCIWKGLYAKYFEVEFFSSSRPQPSNMFISDQIDWKKIFKQAFFSEDVWNTSSQKAFSDLKMRQHNSVMYLKSGCEWCTCRIGTIQFPSATDRIRTFTFRMKSSVGTMIGLAEASWKYVDCYPGRGFYGVSVNDPYNPKATLQGGPNRNVLSIAYYEEFQQDDTVTMRVDSAERTVTFYRNQMQVASPVSFKQHQQPLIPLCAICGPGSCVEVLSFRSSKSGDAGPSLLPKRRRSSIFNFFETGNS